MATVQHDNSADTAAAGVESPGAKLRAAREQAGLSREQMARRLNLRLPCVAALEDDDYSHLPGETFVRGYIRSYARALKLNEAALLSGFEAARPAPSPPPAVKTRRERRRPISLDGAGQRRPHWGIAVVVVLIGTMWFWQRQDQSALEVLSLDASSNNVSLNLPGGLDQAVPGFESNPLDLVQLLPVSAEQREAPGGAMAAVARMDAGELTLTDSDRLNMRFSADCWVEIKDRDNKVLVAMLKRADEQLQIEGRGPFKVLLGFAPGVEMAYNGRPVDIDVPSGANAARLIVGSS